MLARQKPRCVYLMARKEELGQPGLQTDLWHNGQWAMTVLGNYKLRQNHSVSRVNVARFSQKDSKENTKTIKLVQRGPHSEFQTSLRLLTSMAKSTCSSSRRQESLLLPQCYKKQQMEVYSLMERAALQGWGACKRQDSENQHTMFTEI